MKFNKWKDYKIRVYDNFQVHAVMELAKQQGYRFYGDPDYYIRNNIVVFYLRVEDGSLETGWDKMEHCYDRSSNIPLEWYDLVKFVGEECTS